MRLRKLRGAGLPLIAPLALLLAFASTARANDTAVPEGGAKAGSVPGDATISARAAAPNSAEIAAAPASTISGAHGNAASGAVALGIFSPWPARRPLVRDEARAHSSARRHHASNDPDDDFPRIEWFVGYSFWHATPETTHNRMLYLNGGSTSLAVNVDRHVGIVIDLAGFDDNKVRLPLSGVPPTTVVKTTGDAFTFMAGPRFSFRHDNWTPFGQVLFGAVLAGNEWIPNCYTSVAACRPLPEEIAYGATAGGGLDRKVSEHFAIRVFQVEYFLTGLRNPTTPSFRRSWQGNIRFSTGIVIRSGGNSVQLPPENHPPVASCSAGKSMVFVDSGDSVMVRADASDPDNDPLTYAWSSNGGAVNGDGAQVRWNSSGANLGTYTVRVSVSDGRGGTVACSADIQVAQRPDHPPTLACSADRPMVTIGDVVQITATANSPDNDPLTYTWTSTGGHLRGADAAVQLDTGGAAAGHYSVSGHVDDGHGGTADCMLGIDVQEPPPPPEQVALETRLSLHSIYFATARPTAANPTGGLLDSQQRTLLALASDFQRYLTFRPEAHLILGGHADVRGSEEYNKALTERRVDRTKSFLVEHGVPEADIETQAFGKDDNLTADEVKSQMDGDPDLSPADKQEMLSNMTVLVLANNRRVDVSLSTTGQQSTHRYPFNTADFLALINPAGGTHLKPAATAPRKKTKP